MKNETTIKIDQVNSLLSQVLDLITEDVLSYCDAGDVRDTLLGIDGSFIDRQNTGLNFTNILVGRIEEIEDDYDLEEIE